MGLFDWLTRHKKSLSQMTRSELRRQEFPQSLGGFYCTFTELLGFTMSPNGLRVRLCERKPAIAAWL